MSKMFPPWGEGLDQRQRVGKCAPQSCKAAARNVIISAARDTTMARIRMSWCHVAEIREGSNSSLGTSESARVKAKTEPEAELSFSSRLAPRWLANCLQIARPMPCPPALPERQG